MPRRHDIDALRVIAFALLILYHCAMVYVAEWDFHLKSSHTAEWLQSPMIAMNRWRMPLLFVISGIAIGLAGVETRRWRFAALRTWRLQLPLLFGMFVVVAFQAYCQGRAEGRLAPGLWPFFIRYWRLDLPPGAGGLTWNHLWYLAYLWPYTLLLVVVMPVLRPLRAWLVQPSTPRLAAWLLAVVPIAWLAVVQFALAPRYPETHALFGDWTVHAESLPLFLLGYLLSTSPWFWAWVVQLRWPTLLVACLAIATELSLRWLGRHPPHGPMPDWVLHVPWYAVERIGRVTYTWTALLAIFGWARVQLDRPFRWLPYCSEAVFPWYILHQSLIIALAYWLTPMRFGPVIEPLLLIAGTVAGCLLLHELLIRRIGWLRPLFGLKRRAVATRIKRAARPIEHAIGEQGS
ncbi:Surface polysaccharide O-acyltransferase, integral membrane enzyme [Pseudoxanthomonas sp. GM95]|uniref:acyltransferase family protein n=1 Tax=Pseudoxanthomonas sp. GM95 TaxID=1881043 RepID=UPI0008B67D99|nr:acyltransferase [Pseudoxanthomonas sp. GM95]SEL05671.1 Surface polysaccharide O-acyltransferase, integral membrane enzyme [Pseudoxanthomonas sp. GM95]